MGWDLADLPQCPKTRSIVVLGNAGRLVGAFQAHWIGCCVRWVLEMVSTFLMGTRGASCQYNYHMSCAGAAELYNVVAA